MDEAHTRRDDPDTSHEAAAAITPHLPEIQRRVEVYARSCGMNGFTDAEMEHALDDFSSTLRNRRDELRKRNIIIPTKERRAFGDSARKRVVWVHRAFVTNPPPIIDAPRLITKKERGAGLEHAAAVEQAAKIIRDGGRALFADKLIEAAQFLRQIAA